MIKLKSLLKESNDNLSAIDFNPKEIDFLCKVVNSFSSGGHPMADKRTIGQFKTKFVKRLLDKNMGKIPSSEKGNAKSVKQKLDGVFS